MSSATNATRLISQRKRNLAQRADHGGPRGPRHERSGASVVHFRSTQLRNLNSLQLVEGLEDGKVPRDEQKALSAGGLNAT